MSNKDTGVVICAAFVFLVIGLILGVLIAHTVDKKNIDELNNQIDRLKVEVEEAKVPPVVQEVNNFYYPYRNVTQGNILKNSYKTENFRLNDKGYMEYVDDNGNVISHFGVDLSYHQDKVNWDKLEASGVEFVMLRCGYRGYTEGKILEDEKFHEYAKEANERGIALGVYFFSQAINEKEAIEEAEYCIDILKDYEISYPVAFDTEYVNDSEARTNTADLTDEDRANICIAFCERVKEAGYFPIIYASENWMRRNLDLTMLTQYDFWAPQYLDENDFLFDFTMWQYTEHGKIDGISEDVDLNISMVDYASFVPGLKKTTDTNGTIMNYGDAEAQVPVDEE